MIKSAHRFHGFQPILSRSGVRNLSSIDFNDPKESFKSKTTAELVRAYGVFNLCQIRPLVKSSEFLLKSSYKVFGDKFTNYALKRTMFGHFCAGENEKLIRPTVKFLNDNGVGAILDYASEADIAEEPKDSEDGVNKTEQKTNSMQSLLQARTYDYRDEDLCDSRMDIFKKCINAVHAVSPTGFAAIKLTALGNPKLLETVSMAITERKNLFRKFDPTNRGAISQQVFRENYERYFTGDVEDALRRMGIASKSEREVTYVDWCVAFPVEDLHTFTTACREKGPLTEAALSNDELILLATMLRRVRRLVRLASDLGVRLMIDAEQSYFQPCIDHITMEMARDFNHKYPVVFGTYQMYLKDGKVRFERDMERARQGNYKFAAKIVRGAYMVQERQRAIDLKIEDPINETIQETHAAYNGAIQHVIEKIARGDHEGMEVMFATHNQESVEVAVAAMEKMGVSPDKGVYFGQLLGMADHLSFSLGNAGYKAYKYVPYGAIKEVMPYLIRRAQENSGALSGAVKELRMIRREIWRRLTSNEPRVVPPASKT